MFQMLETKSEIATARRILEQTITRAWSERQIRTIGYPGGKIFDATVHTNGQVWFFTTDARHAANPRRLNWFGVLGTAPGLEITVEINTPYCGRNDQTSGFFAREINSGSIYLMHSGRVGGGQPGVGKNGLLAWSGLDPIEVADTNGGQRFGLVVMPIKGRQATKSLASYVDTIRRFKVAARHKKLDTPELRRRQNDLRDYFKEATGRRRGRRSAAIDYVSRHGDIVDAVYKWRLTTPLPKGARIAKSILVDLCVVKGRDRIEVFEVKTSASRNDVYAAIGQLMVHGTSDSCRRYIVLPHDEHPQPDVANALTRLRIQQLRFRLSGGDVKLL